LGAGDVWSITTCLRDAGEVKPNNETFTWAVRATSDYGGVLALDAAWRAALPSLLNVMSDGVNAVGAFYKKWLPSPESPVGLKFPTYIAGGVSAQPLPLASSALVLRQSGFAGRNVNGRLYLPWLPVQYADPAIPNRIVEIDRLAIEQACRDVDDSLQSGATGSSWRSVVISSRSLETPGVYETPIVGWTCMADFRSLPQRARRDYRCPFEDRWLAIAPWNSFAQRKSLGGSWANSGSNALGWKYWLTNGARGGDDGPVDPAWTSPDFVPTGWHVGISVYHPGRRFCPGTFGPGGTLWPPVVPNANLRDPPEFELGTHGHYIKSSPAVPNSTSAFLNEGEIDYYRCTFKVFNVPVVRTAQLRLNYLDGCAHYINGVEVWNNLGDTDGAPPACREGETIDIFDHLLFENQPNCWGVIHQPGGSGGSSVRGWPRYADHRPPNEDFYDSWWAGEIRIGGTVE
jgi:hypothetical protein